MATEPIPSTEAPATVREFSVAAEESQLSSVRDFIADVCRDAGFTTREVSNAKLAVDEACTNIIKHAYADTDGEITIRVEMRPGNIVIALRDTGKRFDFAGVQDPDLDQYVETGKKGGLGIFLINRLMDGVSYTAGSGGNELVMSKRSHAAVSRGLPGKIGWRGSLRYKFTMRATVGLFVIIAAIWGYIFNRQSASIDTQRANQWIEKKRLAENVAAKSTELLLNPQSYSVEQTTLTAFVRRMMDSSDDLAYIRVVDNSGSILSSSTMDEIFTVYQESPGTELLRDGQTRWRQVMEGERPVRDIDLGVQVRGTGSRAVQTVGHVYIGVYEDMVTSDVHDPRLVTTLIILACFLIGVLLISGLVSVFVKPIQVLTDGVRAIGQGSLEGKISVDGPAEIGAIASVFNEITEKFKQAQENVLEQEKLQKEIEVAKQIQHALLPKRHPDISGYDIAPYYQAAKEVGGDYYDFVKVDEETLGVVVADVSGKGVPGSLVMTMIRTALRMEARDNKNASDVMAKMNEFVTDDMKKGMFVTMFYIILDSKNRIISYASAGHNPMILFRAEVNETYFLNPKGFPVGISLPDDTLFRRSISLEKIKLKKDDMLVIYTDGVTEAMNEKREQYGEERLISLVKKFGTLHPTKFIDKLEADVREFTGGAAQNDDITVVAIKEKLAADDVLYGIRKRLLELVDVDGLSVKEACAKMKVSPATYYRYKKRLAVLGERGLRNKILRQDMALKRVSIEQRKEILTIIVQNPDFGAKRITQEFNVGKEPARHLNEKILYEELCRLNLNTKELRLEYLRRNRLIAEDSTVASDKSAKELVEDFISEVSDAVPGDLGLPPSGPQAGAPGDGADVPAEIAELAEAGDALDRMETPEGTYEVLDEDGEDGELMLRVSNAGEDVLLLEVDGHLDSVSSSTLERRLQDLIDNGASRIAVDLSRVAYISSGGWGIFVGEVRRVRETGGDVVLIGMAQEVYDVYELLGFGDILKSCTTINDAFEYFRRPAEERLAAIPERFSPADHGSPLISESVEPGGSPLEWESLQIEAGTVGDRGDTAVISLRGIIDTISAENLRAAIDKVITNGINKIVVDMSQVEYVSSGGWGTFTERLREVRRAEGDIKLFGMDPDVYYVFTMLGFNIVLSSFDILADAIEDFDRASEERPSVHPNQSPELTLPPEPASTEDYDTAQLDKADWDEPSPPMRVESGSAVEWNDYDGRVVGALSGTVDATTAGNIEAEIEARLGSKPRVLVFDMGAVTYVSSAGWGIFAKYHERVVAWGGCVALCAMNQDLHDVFSLLEFRSFIDVYPSQQAALAELTLANLEARQALRESDRTTVVDDSRNPDDVLGPSSTVEPATGAVPPVAPNEPVDVEDILGGGTLPEHTRSGGWEDDATPPAEPPDTSAWGKSAPEETADTVPRDSADAAEHAESTASGADAFDAAGETGVGDRGDFATPGVRRGDFERDPANLDVDRSVTHDRVDEDKKLRKMGWDEYGRRLRHKRGEHGERDGHGEHGERDGHDEHDGDDGDDGNDGEE